MNTYVLYVIFFVILLVLELAYFKIADKFNIIDKPNQRSSHNTIVLRGGGIIFTIAAWIWIGYRLVVSGSGLMDCYPWFLFAVTLAAGVSFIDDIKSLPDSVRLVAQFAAMALMFIQLDILHLEMWWIVILALIVCVGATNVYNFMDGINGITGGYSLAVIVPMMIANVKWMKSTGVEVIDHSFLNVIAIALLVFCFFNFRQRGKAKCFAGDVGSIGIAFILLFAIGKLVIASADVTWLMFIIVYGVDGCMTIAHRIMLHEHLGEAHRKHAYQLMANELKMSHPVVSGIYMAIQLAISLGMIYLVPDTVMAHWIYLVAVLLVLILAYVAFMKKYYHLHEEYLKSVRG